MSTHTESSAQARALALYIVTVVLLVVFAVIAS